MAKRKTIPFNVWSTGGDGTILACMTCYKIHLFIRSHGRAGLRGIPAYKTERGAAGHLLRKPAHEIVGVEVLRAWVLGYDDAGRESA